MKAHGKSSSGVSSRAVDQAAGSQVLSSQAQQQILLSQSKKNSLGDQATNHFSSNLLKLHPQAQSQQPCKQSREQQRGQSPHGSTAQQIIFHQSQQEAQEHFNSGSKALSSSGKQQIGQLRSNSPSQPHFLKRAPSQRNTTVVPQTNQVQQNLNLKMPQISENKWGVSSLGVGAGGVHAQHSLRTGHGWLHDQFAAEQLPAQQNNNAQTNVNLASMPPAGLASGGSKQAQAAGNQPVSNQQINSQQQQSDFFHQYLESSQRVNNGQKQQSGVDWLSEEKTTQTNQLSSAIPITQTQPGNNIFYQQPPKISHGRKIGVIHGAHPPPFIQNTQRSKNAPFVQNVANQAIFMNSNSRRNFTTSKEEGSGIAATSFGSNQSISQGAIVAQAAGSSEGDTSSTCNTRIGGFKAAGQTAISAISTNTNVNTLNASLLANDTTANEISRTGSKFPKSVAFEIAKPQVIQNRGQSGGPTGAPKKNFRRPHGVNSDKQNIFSVGLSLVGQPLQADSNLNQMTPGSVKDKQKQRITMNDTTKSIKLPFQQKGQITKLPHSLEKLQEEHMQQAQPIRPQGGRQINSKMPPIKAPVQEHQTQVQTSSDQQQDKIQIQKDSSVSQTIRNKIKAKAIRLAELQAQKIQQQSNENKDESQNSNFLPIEKKKLPIHLQAIRSQAKAKDEATETEQVQKSISSFSNGTVPNQPPVSPEDAKQAAEQTKQNAPFQIQIQKADQQSPDSDPHEDVESCLKPQKEVSKHHTRLRLIQRQSKRLQFMNPSQEAQDQQEIEELKEEEMKKHEMDRANANVSSFVCQQPEESDDFERDQQQEDIWDQDQQMESHDSILGHTESSLQLNEAQEKNDFQQFPLQREVRENRENEVGNGLSMVYPKTSNRYQVLQDDDYMFQKPVLTFEEQSLTVPQEQVLSVSGNSSFPRLPGLHIQGKSAVAINKGIFKPQPPLQQSSINSKSNHPSTDSSFARTFKLLVEESSELRRMYSEIIRKQLSQQDKVYNKFVYDIHSRMRQYKKNNFYKSMRLERRTRDLIDEELTFDMVVKHIEHEKTKQIHSEKFRFVHSDMSGQHLSNSVHQSHASILSPDSASFGHQLGGAILRAGKGLQQLRLKRTYQHYNSFSMGLIASQARLFTLPDLNHRHRNSVSNIREVIGLSENNSHRFGPQKASSNSNQTTPLTINSIQNGSKITAKEQPQNAIKNLPMSLHQLYRGKTTLAQKQHQILVPQQEEVTENNPKIQTKILLPQLIPMAIEHHQKLNEKFIQEQLKRHQNFDQRPKQHQNKIKQVQGKLIQWYEGVLIGQGTTGVVNLAMFKDTGAYFVVKKIRLVHSFLGLDQNRVRAIKKEIDMYKTLKHDHIVEYYGCEVIENNTMCIYLEYMPGGSIADGYKRFSSNYDEKICRLYTYQILDALHYLHSRDIVHGDLKGANVLLSKDGEKVKLCDLGNARQLESSFSSINTVVNGTLAWMAPEAQFSKIGCKSDIWSLGCLLVEMLTGANPWGNRFEDGNQAFMLQRALQNEETPLIPTENISQECQNFIARCLKHQYRERPHAHELLEDPWLKN